jgi:hypothetical protein
MTHETLMQQITAYDVASRNELVFTFILDTNNPLDQRWEVYKSAVDSGYLHNPSSCLPDFNTSLPEIDLLIDYLDKYESFNYESLISDYSDMTEEQEILVKELIMQDGHSSWENNW